MAVIGSGDVFCKAATSAVRSGGLGPVGLQLGPKIGTPCSTRGGNGATNKPSYEEWLEHAFGHAVRIQQVAWF
jgi:hypothetical protein